MKKQVTNILHTLLRVQVDKKVGKPLRRRPFLRILAERSAKYVLGLDLCGSMIKTAQN